MTAAQEACWQDMRDELAVAVKLSEYTKPNRYRKQERVSLSSSKGKKNSGPHPAFFKSISSSRS